MEGAAETASGQSVPQKLTCSRQPTLDRADRPAQLPGRPLVRQTFHVAHDDRCAVLFGKTVNLRVEQVEETLSMVVSMNHLQPQFSGAVLVLTPAQCGAPGSRSDPTSHAM